MKTRYILPVLAGLFLLQIVSGATDIRRIETEVWLVKNGNAVVRQTWDVNVTQGTEWYIPIDNLGQRTVRDLSVYENNIKIEIEITFKEDTDNIVFYYDYMDATSFKREFVEIGMNDESSLVILNKKTVKLCKI